MNFMLVVGLSFLRRLFLGYLRCPFLGLVAQGELLLCRALPCIMLLSCVCPFHLSPCYQSNALGHKV